MMDKSSASELIYAKALGCLNPETQNELTEYLKLGGDLTWSDLGELQNLVSLLPITLEISTPASTLKDKIARKIYNAIEEEKARRSAELQEIENKLVKEQESQPSNYSTTIEQASYRTEFVEDITTQNDELESSEQETIEAETENKLEEPAELLKSSQLDLVDAEDFTKINEELKEKVGEQEKKEEIDKIPLTRKKYEVVEQVETIKKKSAGGVILDIILYVLLLIAIGFVYVKLSGEIKELKKEVERLKKNNTSTISFEILKNHLYV